MLDTNAIIYALNQGFSFPKAEYFVSIITEIELLSYSKLTTDDEKMLKEVLGKFKSINLSNDVKEKTIEIRKNNAGSDIDIEQWNMILERDMEVLWK